jgi:hypothetical protein
MNLIWRLMYAPGAAVGLCSNCSWGTVRKGFLADEAETFCRLVGPSARVRYAVRECTSYCDRRATTSASEARRYGFVTEIKLEDGSEVRVGSNEESAKPGGEE